MVAGRTEQLASAFRALHEPGRILLLPNAWDALSARVIQECGAQAIATTSSGLSWAHGCSDGEHLSPEVLVTALGEIVRASALPVTADIEAGYSRDPKQVGVLVSAIIASGAVGINLEDGAAPADLLVAKIGSARRASASAGVSLFVNARTDVFLKRLVSPERAIDETVARARRYREAGADGIFVPGLIEPEAIRCIAEAVALPLNVMVGAGLPPMSVLQGCGVRRVSAGASLCRASFGAARRATERFLAEHQYDLLLDGTFAQAELNAMFAKPD